MISNLLKTIFLVFLFANMGLSQSVIDRHAFCAHDADLYEKVKTDPEYARKVDSVEQIQASHRASYTQTSNRSGTIYYIPVVYHIVHEGGIENISDAQVKSDMEALNDAYRKRNANSSQVVSSFSGIAADIEIEFRLAQKKPDGSCFSGITRTYSSTTNQGGNAAISAIEFEHGTFPGDQYMNIIVARDIGGAAGYTYRPGFPFNANMRNAIHVLHNYVGTMGTYSLSGYNTTIAHEAGHWLNLPHTWGNSNNPGLASNCGGDDGISDTPLTIGWTTCNVNGVSCGSLDNVENIMEYSYCSKMFTEGQKTAMRAAATSSIGGRSNVISPSNHIATGIFDDIICNANFESERSSYCEGDPVQFYDLSYHNPTTWAWSFPGGTPSSSNQENPVVTYSSAGRHSVSLTVTNASGTKSAAKTQYVRILPSWGQAMPYSESFEMNLTQFNDQWETSSTASNQWGIANSSYSGATSATLRNFNLSEGVASELTSPALNLTGNSSVNISYRYSYARKPSTSGESVQFLISQDCGATWIIARGLNTTVPNTSSEFFPTNNGQWRAQNINISSSFFTSNFRFRIRVVNGDGNNFFIDDININNVVGIEEVEGLTNLNLFPNPMNTSATVSLKLSKESNVNVSLLNTLGQSVKSITFNQRMTQGEHTLYIEKGNLSPGIYFVSVELNGNRKLEKLIIQ